MKVVIFSSDHIELGHLHAQLAAASGYEILPVPGSEQELDSVIERFHPHILVMDGVHFAPAAYGRLEKTIAANPGMPVVLLAKSLEPEFLLQMMRMGVAEVLPQPVSPQALKEAVERASHRVQQQKPARGTGKVLAMVGCKGGSGTTFLAANLGYAVASLNPALRVVLIDLNLQGGDAELFISDRHAISSVGSIAAEIQRLDETLLETSLIKVLPNYGVLPAVHDTHEAYAVKPEHINLLLDVAVQHYDLVILDMPHAVDPVTVKAFDRANEIYLVLQLPLPFIRDTKKMMSDFRALGYGPEKVRLIVNRHEADPDITIKDVQHALGAQIYHAVPNSYRHVTASVNQGLPIIKLEPHDPVSRTLVEMAGNLMHLEHAAQPKGWLSMFKGK